MIRDRFTVRARLANWMDTIEFVGWEKLPGYAAVAQPVTLKTEDDPYSYQIAPMFEMTRENAQKLMDDLWECGLRPSSGVGSVGQLAATEYHLEDMRKLVFESKK